VVELADKFFSVRTGGNVTVHTADGFKFIAEAKKPYDVIYMDAFLKPSADTDGTGAPLSLRTQQFYEQMQSKLKPGGVVVYNLNPHPQLADDIRQIAEAFPQTYVFPLARYGGAVVVGSTVAERVPPQELAARGLALDRRFKSDLSFQAMARRVQH
jgi:spermidine synthase